MNEPKKPETSAEALQYIRYQEWLSLPMTRLFFLQLHEDQRNKLLTTCKDALSTGTGPTNAREHNNLVMAATYQKIIETYEHPSCYPIKIKLSPKSGEPIGG